MDFGEEVGRVFSVGAGYLVIAAMRAGDCWEGVGPVGVGGGRGDSGVRGAMIGGVAGFYGSFGSREK